DFVLTETAEFWRKGAEYERGELRPEEVQTEVFFFPAAAHSEKDGSFTNAHRLVQWHHKAIEPPGEARSELHFLFHLGRRLKQLYAGSSDPKDRPLLELTWDYPTEGPYDEPSAESIVREINGYTIADGKPVSGYTKLQADGSTASGCWLYSGCFADGVNQL
ncbi:MAG TPA: formate dehydrogenase, partial [Myxococcales bacterium]|nr:formate dehydrogenase [Myxococcales bacterium]